MLQAVYPLIMPWLLAAGAAAVSSDAQPHVTQWHQGDTATALPYAFYTPVTRASTAEGEPTIHAIVLMLSENARLCEDYQQGIQRPHGRGVGISVVDAAPASGAASRTEGTDSAIKPGKYGAPKQPLQLPMALGEFYRGDAHCRNSVTETLRFITAGSITFERIDDDCAAGHIAMQNSDESIHLEGTFRARRCDMDWFTQTPLVCIP